MGNNPVRNIDPLGDTIVINLFGSYDYEGYHKAVKNAVLNPNINDGVFLVFGHGGIRGVQHEGDDNQPTDSYSATEILNIIAKKSPEFMDALKSKKEIILKMITCNSSAENEYITRDNTVVKSAGINIATKMSEELSKSNSESRLIAPDGFVSYNEVNGKWGIYGVRQTSYLQPENTGQGGWVTFKNGKKVSKQKDAFNGTLSPTRGPKKKVE